MSFNPLSVAKIVASGIVGIGTGKIVGKIIKNNVTPETLIDKVTVTAAAWVIGAMATQATKNMTHEMIDDAVGSVTEVVNKIKTEQKLNRIQRGESTFAAEGLNAKDYEKTLNGKYKYVGEKKDSDEKLGEILEEHDKETTTTTKPLS